MSDVTIKYKGQSIATMDATGSKTLHTQGKYCEGDIAAEYVKPAGPTGTKSISITANGTTTEDVAAYANAKITVDVQGGGGGGSSDLDPFPIPSGYSLPANYQKLLYCESSGTQMCDSGVHPTISTKIEIAGYYIPGTYGAYKYLFGCNNPSIYLATNGYNTPLFWGFGNKSDFSGIKNSLSGIPILSLSAQEARIENAPFPDLSTSCGATSLPDTDPDTTIGILGRFTGRTIDRQAPARFYRARIWENGTLIRCIFPVLKDGSEVCMYDVINGTYMPNVGTGVFVGVT